MSPVTYSYLWSHHIEARGINLSSISCNNRDIVARLVSIAAGCCSEVRRQIRHACTLDIADWVGAFSSDKLLLLSVCAWLYVVVRGCACVRVCVCAPTIYQASPPRRTRRGTRYGENGNSVKGGGSPSTECLNRNT